jgi:drug/metabolite transporter (DMT)-like permease
MGRRAGALGALYATFTAVTWGGQFVVGKSALDRVNAFPLTTVRYAVAGAVLLAVLAAVEGRDALRLGGRGRELLWLGTLGFAGFNLLAYTGLAHARPESAALIVALGPLLTALVLWRRTSVRPHASTFGFLAAALAGVFLVLSKGHPGTVVGGSVGWGDGLVLVGVFSFVLYGLGAAAHRELSPLRYTALTAGLGWLGIAAATAIALAAGLVAWPSGHDLWDVTPQIAYLALPGAVLAVLAWNAAIDSIGPQNAVLFGNLIPVTTFAIQIVRGYRPGWVEAGGAVLTVAALLANSLRVRAAAQPRGEEPVELDAVPEAA